METFFLDYEPLLANPEFHWFAGDLRAQFDAGDAAAFDATAVRQRPAPIDSPHSFNRFCRLACQMWAAHFGREIARTNGAVPPERVLLLRSPIVVRDLARALSIAPQAVLADLLCENMLVNINQTIGAATAAKVCEAHGFALQLEPTPEHAHPLFPACLERIRKGGPSIIPTGWGGVVIKRHEPPEVEKWLVIRQGRYLALEKHELKEERLEVREGAGLLLSRHGGRDDLAVQAVAPGDRFHLPPGREHCLIGTADLLIYETSMDPKGMDQDLIFLYEPDDEP